MTGGEEREGGKREEDRWEIVACEGID